ncbi:N-acetylneuraminate 9-O-acetyltransferase [Halotydeus destructor]|nr:N-acetylneuraminate 9-O-acetyltransferase [Halotydeus destructor]
MKSWSDPSQYFNARTAKKLTLVIVIGFVIYHGFLHVSYGIDSCKWLLSDGRFQGDHIWQPYGCMLHNYTKADSRMCMRYIAYWGGTNHIVFMGDSRIRQLYNTFTRLVSTKNYAGPSFAHHDLTLTDSNLNLETEFIWAPIINGTMFEMYRRWQNTEASKRPKIVITGCATWSIKTSNASNKALEDYKSNLTRLLSSIESLGKQDTQILWVLQDPVDQEKLSKDRKMITNEQVDLYNKAALDILKYCRSDNVRVWSSARLASQGYSSDQTDGLHMGEVALHYALQILLNMYCNDQLNYNDGNCCSDPESTTAIQIITLSFFSCILAIAVALVIHRRFTKRERHKFTLLVNQDDDNEGESYELSPMEGEGEILPTQSLINGPTRQTAFVEPSTKSQNYIEVLTCTAKFGLILTFFFLCDRTNFFMKENKYFTKPNFFLPIAYVFALGLFFTEESKQTTLLHRDQTDEWKGWMQLVILTYHMTGASQVLPIYNHIRLLVSAYLFLSGFGHFTYFWHKGDHGFHRLWQYGLKYFPLYWRNRENRLRRLFEVMFRLNFLVICLCLVMNRPYQFYYFVPLISFWFIMLYITLSVPPHVTAQSSEANPIQYLYMVIKFVVLMSVISILHMSEVLFEKIFLTRPWKALFVTTDDSIKEWWFRWKIDRYSVPAGMVFAFAYQVLKQHRLIHDNNHGSLFPKGVTVLLLIASCLGILIYEVFAFTCRNKSECNEIHPYIFFIPIVSFITLRNLSGLLRSRYSAFFAWFGRISLELFVGQYHIWLAANTHGVLVLVPSYPVLNVVVTLVIFVWVSHELHCLTGHLVNFAVPSDWRYMARNLIIFILILIPIGIKDGMF